jgi:hypothetical protein
LARLAALFPAATTVSCARVMMLLRVIFQSRSEDTHKHRTRDNQSLEEVRGLCWVDSNVRFGSLAHKLPPTKIHLRPLLSESGQ